MAGNYIEDLRLAHILADRADQITMNRYRAQDLSVETKPDLTPVTDADLAVEDAIRSILATARPRDAVHGEEREDTGFSERRWVIDPIDGTKNFLRGVPVWATIIGLMVNDIVVAGVVSAPALNKRWWAAHRSGAYVGKSLVSATQMQVSKVTRLADASLSYSSLDGWLAIDRGPQFVNMMQACWRTRAYGDFWSYMLVAEGAVDIAAEPELSLHDIAGVDIIVREAGGSFTSIDGTPGPFGPGALATNGLLHPHVLATLTNEK